MKNNKNCKMSAEQVSDNGHTSGYQIMMEGSGEDLFLLLSMLIQCVSKNVGMPSIVVGLLAAKGCDAIPDPSESSEMVIDRRILDKVLGQKEDSQDE